MLPAPHLMVCGLGTGLKCQLNSSLHTSFGLGFTGLPANFTGCCNHGEAVIKDAFDSRGHHAPPCFVYIFMLCPTTVERCDHWGKWAWEIQIFPHVPCSFASDHESIHNPLSRVCFKPGQPCAWSATTLTYYKHTASFTESCALLEGHCLWVAAYNLGIAVENDCSSTNTIPTVECSDWIIVNKIKYALGHI